MNGYKITAFRVQHNITCYGYSLEISRKGKFDVERAKAQEIPIKCWNPLQERRDCHPGWKDVYAGHGPRPCQEKD